MAKSLSRLAIVITVALVLQFSSLIKPVVCTSRKALRGHHHHHHHGHQKKTVEDGFRVELKHVDHGKNLTKLQRIQRAVMRGNMRLEQLSETTAMSTMSAATSPSSPGIKARIQPGQGEFLMNLSIGTPPLPFSAIVDTGSDLIWTQCQPCVHCYRQPSPVFSPSNSSSYAPLPCNAALCSALPVPSCSDDEKHCAYTYEYGDYSTTSGTLATETLTFSDSKSVSHIGFGCGDENQGGGFDQGGGLVGLGRGPLSLVSQLKEPKFSYCLAPLNTDAAHDGALLLGSLADVMLSNSTSAAVTTPLARNPSQPSFYYLNLEGISVGGDRLPVPKSAFKLNDDGSGGMIIDSGTTITYLEASAYGPLRAEILKRVKLEVADNASVEDTGLDLCFKMPAGAGARPGTGYGFGPGPVDVDVPDIVFHFENADLKIPRDNYLLAVAAESEEDPDMLCFAMGDASGSGMSVFGNVQQQNLLVLHDLKKETLTFVPTNCDAL